LTEVGNLETLKVVKNLGRSREVESHNEFHLGKELKTLGGQESWARVGSLERSKVFGGS
jgi:hypothetical protein